MEDVILMYTSPSSDNYEKYGVDYVVSCSKEDWFFDRYDLVPYNFSRSSAFTSEYTDGSCNVYSVDYTKLPETSEITRDELNYTLYSRWYQGV